MCPPSRQQSPLRSTCSEMRHLLSYTVYDRDGALGEDMRSTLDSIGADGLELLTSYDHPDPCFRGVTESVHLPYATDWMAAWEGRPYDMDDDSARFYMFGRSREDVVSNVADAIRYARPGVRRVPCRGRPFGWPNGQGHGVGQPQGPG